jgi:GR25 family glycosyltransferase involved in LPS biosynthesis
MNVKTVIINMKRNPERLDFMTKQLKENDITFEIQEGFDGSTYDFSGIYNDEAYKKLNNGNTMSLGERGCALSHRTAVEKFLASDATYGLIMEDDVELPSFFKNIIDEAVKNREDKKTSWEYLSFNYPSVGTKAIVLWLFLFFTMFNGKKGLFKYLTLPIYGAKFIVISILSLLEGAREVLYKKLCHYGKPARFLRPLYLAGCYLITKEGAKKLLASQGDMLSYTADRLPNVARVQQSLKFFGFSPLYVIQRRDKFQSNSVDKAFDEKVKKFMGGRLLRE